MGVKLKGIKVSQAILKQCPEFKQGVTVKVGVAEGSTYPNGQSVAEVAFWNEEGIPHKKLPARPFMGLTVLKNADQWGNQFEYILKQSGFQFDQAAEAFGNMIVGQVKMEINTLMEPSLSPYTIKRKGTNKPLIDTGLLLNSITYQIEKK